MVLRRSIFWSALAAFHVEAQGRRGGGERYAPGSQSYPPQAANAAEKLILDTLDEMVKVGDTYANVPPADGKMLRTLAESTGAKHVLEIGTSTGISGLWFCMALSKTGGHITTLDIDRGRAETARKNFAKAGVSKLVTQILGDAHETMKKVKGPFDIVFIDAEKEGYVDYLNQSLPSVRPGGLILAHNVDMIADYIKLVSTRADLDTSLYMSGGGLAITLKKR